MAGRGARNEDQEPLPMVGGARPCFLLVEARFYEDVADALAAGAIAELEAHGATFERVSVPGALEIPQALALAAAQGFVTVNGGGATYAGAVALGCVIRGETSHYDIVCDNANHWLMDVAVRNAFPVGNAILTVDTHAQAMVRALGPGGQGGREGKGADAARAALALYRLAFRLDAAIEA